jgi:calcineurin-like phosphoesterase family protein
MNETMVNNWNSLVGKQDTVYHLGDFSFCPNQYFTEKLNGNIILITGNHDKDVNKKCFAAVHKSYYETKIEEIPITMCHYAMKVWNKSHYGAFMLHGHSHNSLKEDPNALSFDVGVDAWKYYPVSFEQVKQKMATKTFKPIDHHGAENDR